MTSHITEVNLTISLKTRLSLAKVKAIHHCKRLNHMPKQTQDLELCSSFQLQKGKLCFKWSSRMTVNMVLKCKGKVKKLQAQWTEIKPTIWSCPPTRAGTCSVLQILLWDDSHSQQRISDTGSQQRLTSLWDKKITIANSKLLGTYL